MRREEKIVKAGWVKKSPPQESFFANFAAWKFRYLVLVRVVKIEDGDDQPMVLHVLRYYKHELDVGACRKPKGTIVLRDCTSISAIIDAKIGNLEHVIKLVHPNRIYYFATSSGQERDRWIHCLDKYITTTFKWRMSNEDDDEAKTESREKRIRRRGRNKGFRETQRRKSSSGSIDTAAPMPLARGSHLIPEDVHILIDVKYDINKKKCEENLKEGSNLKRVSESSGDGSYIDMGSVSDTSYQTMEGYVISEGTSFDRTSSQESSLGVSVNSIDISFESSSDESSSCSDEDEDEVRDFPFKNDEQNLMKYKKYHEKTSDKKDAANSEYVTNKDFDAFPDQDRQIGQSYRNDQIALLPKNVVQQMNLNSSSHLPYQHHTTSNQKRTNDIDVKTEIQEGYIDMTGNDDEGNIYIYKKTLHDEDCMNMDDANNDNEERGNAEKILEDDKDYMDMAGEKLDLGEHVDMDKNQRADGDCSKEEEEEEKKKNDTDYEVMNERTLSVKEHVKVKGTKQGDKDYPINEKILQDDQDYIDMTGEKLDLGEYVDMDKNQPYDGDCSKEEEEKKSYTDYEVMNERTLSVKEHVKVKETKQGDKDYPNNEKIVQDDQDYMDMTGEKLDLGEYVDMDKNQPADDDCSKEEEEKKNDTDYEVMDERMLSNKDDVNVERQKAG